MEHIDYSFYQSDLTIDKVTEECRGIVSLPTRPDLVISILYNNYQIIRFSTVYRQWHAGGKY